MENDIKYFVGKNPSNHAIVGNGEVAVLFQQFQGGRPVDRVHRILYPYFDRSAGLLGEAGIHTVASVAGERVRYDFYQDAENFISVDNARYLDGAGIYEVDSHQGVIRMRTTTWVPRGVNALVRRIEARLSTDAVKEVEIFPQIDLKGSVYTKAGIIISKVKSGNEDVFLAVDCPEALSLHLGDISETCGEEKMEISVPLDHNLEQPFTIDFEEEAAIQCAANGRKPNLSFVARVEAGKERYSAPVHLVMGFGRNEQEALDCLNSVKSSDDCLFESTLSEWREWLGQGKRPPRLPETMVYTWNVSESVLRMCVQKNGLAVYNGYWKYQGQVWVRDGVWMAMAPADAGHLKESGQILNGLKRILKKDDNGYIYCVYNCRTGENAEDVDATENDFAGLLLAAVWHYHSCSKDSTIIKEFWDIISYCADWICENRDHTGLIAPCSGIWEEFSPRLGLEYEHMTWSSGVSAYGLSVAGKMAEFINEPTRADAWNNVNAELVEAIQKNCVEKGVLCRSMESNRLDSSVLVFFQRFNIFGTEKELLANTVAACEKRLVDPELGGVWRHEEVFHARGDGQPWHGCTLWLAEAYMAMGEFDKARKHIDWTLRNSTQCGLMAEEVLATNILGGIPMPSYSQGGFLLAGTQVFEKERVR